MNEAMKAYILKNYQDYGINFKSQEEMKGLLNILEAYGEDLDSFHDVIINELDDFLGIGGGWNTDEELYESIMEFHKFLTEKEFIDYMINEFQVLKDIGFDDPAEEMKHWNEGEATDTIIYKTSDGYVVSVYY